MLAVLRRYWHEEVLGHAHIGFGMYDGLGREFRAFCSCGKSWRY